MVKVGMIKLEMVKVGMEMVYWLKVDGDLWSAIVASLNIVWGSALAGTFVAGCPKVDHLEDRDRDEEDEHQEDHGGDGGEEDDDDQHGKN